MTLAFRVCIVQVGTCEHGISCSQLVALVLYLPGEVTEEGAEREVKCDYWRIWSNARHSPEYHHAAMRRIAAYYKGMQVPGLSRVKIWSDGDPTTYKGRKQFGRMVRWPRSAADGGEGIELHHNCLPAHHGAGAQDNAGKDPRRAMDRAIIHEKANTIYSYYKCYAWCVKNMARPSDKHDHRGTFGCNGRYIWGAFSNGEDENPLGAQVLDVRDRDFRAIAGSADMYVFRARNPDPTAPELECWFVPCYCSGCREAGSTIQGPTDAESCVYRCITRAPVWPFCNELHVPGRRHVPARRAARRRRRDDSDDDSG